MAADVAMGGIVPDYELPPRKKPKISELPLSSAQRASIDGMLHIFKKKGEFDALRKKVFQQYNESAQRGLFEAGLRNFTAGEINRDPLKYLKPDRRMGAPLLEGAAARGNVYTKTEQDVDAYINQYLAKAEHALREIRSKEVGEENAKDERRKGATSDEVYAAEANVRRKQREVKHKEELRIQKKKEAQEKKKKELEALKKKQEELMKETERLQREQKRRAEREAWKAAEKEKERERIRKYNEERERQKKEVEEREKRAQEEKEQRQKEQLEREQKRLEEEALESLLREGRAMAGKSRRPDRDRSESMDPPLRPLRSGGAPRSLASKDDMRSQGLMPTSLTLKRGDRPQMPLSEDREASSRGVHDENARHADHRARSATPPYEARIRARREDSREDSQRLRNDRSSRGHFYRDISAEREAWKARNRGSRGESKGGEEGEVVERVATRARSRSRESARRRRESRSPQRRKYRDMSRSRSPARHRDRSRRRERSRSPPGIDRYVPGMNNRRVTNKEDEERHVNRRARDEGDRETDRRRRDDRGRYDDRPKPVDIDRYVPGGGRSDDVDGGRRTERLRSRDRDRHRDRSRERRRSRNRE